MTPSHGEHTHYICTHCTTVRFQNYPYSRLSKSGFGIVPVSPMTMR